MNVEIVDSLFLLLLGIVVGPMYCSQHILSRNKLYLEKDVGDFEMHETFAGQILSTLKAMASQKFADAKFGDKKVVEVDYDTQYQGQLLGVRASLWSDRKSVGDDSVSSVASRGGALCLGGGLCRWRDGACVHLGTARCVTMALAFF
jgi:hypothetical protein